jgi:hypothetical protein
LIVLGWGEVLSEELDASRLHFSIGDAGVRPWRVKTGLEALGRSFDHDVGERRRFSPILAEGLAKQVYQQETNSQH